MLSSWSRDRVSCHSRTALHMLTWGSLTSKMNDKGRLNDFGRVQVLVPAVEAVPMLEKHPGHEAGLLHEKVHHGVLLKHAYVIRWQRLLQHLPCTHIGFQD